jgi:hypothetical protein
MKKIILFLTFFLLTFSLSAQLSLDATEMITVENKKKTIQKIEGKITVNTDTTQIEVKIDQISFTEKIGDFSSFNDFGEVKVYIYNQEEGYLVLQILQDKLYMVMFGGKGGKLEFR